jgi:hypothetical protein
MAAAALGKTLLISLRRRDDEKERERLRYVYQSQLLLSMRSIISVYFCCASRKGARRAKGKGYRRHSGQSLVQVNKFPESYVQPSIYRLERYVQVAVERDAAPPKSIDPSIVAASGIFSMGCVGLSKREGGTAPTRNVEESRGLGKRRGKIPDADWVGVG